MQPERIFKLIFFCLIIICIFPGKSFSQLKEEKEEQAIEEQQQKIKPKIPTYKFVTSAGQFIGFDSNPRLERESKSDMFEEFRYSLRYSKFWIHDTTFNLSYNLNALNYNEATDVSNILNYLNFELDKKLWSFSAGTGYSLAAFAYPRNGDGDMLFHTFFFYLRDKIKSNLMHQLTFESSLKNYLSKNTLADSPAVFQSENRSDRRLSGRYMLIWAPFKKIAFRLNGKYSKNDSNARFDDYYDYDSYSLSATMSYKFSPRFNLYFGPGYYKKDYKSRYVTGSDYRQDDTTLTARCGLNYKFNGNNYLSLSYSYRNNSSSEPLDEYNSNTVACGWQYKF